MLGEAVFKHLQRRHHGSDQKGYCGNYGEDRLEEILKKPLDSEIHPFDPAKIVLSAGSTDVGDVGYAAPTLNINIATALHRERGAYLADGRPVLQSPGPQRASYGGPGTALSCIRTMTGRMSLKRQRKRSANATAAPIPVRCPTTSFRRWKPTKRPSAFGGPARWPPVFGGLPDGLLFFEIRAAKIRGEPASYRILRGIVFSFIQPDPLRPLSGPPRLFYDLLFSPATWSTAPRSSSRRWG